MPRFEMAATKKFAICTLLTSGIEWSIAARLMM